MLKKKVLFVCTFYGARSLIAYAFAREYLQERVEAHCCCFERGVIGQKIYDLMTELSIESLEEQLPSMFELIHNDEKVDYVVTLCNPDTREDCETLLDASKELVKQDSNILMWPIQDYLSLDGQEDQWMNRAREIRDNIKAEVLQLVKKIEEIEQN